MGARMAHRFVGSKKARTVEQLRKIRCQQCGKLGAVHQWSSCANGNRYVAVCLDCDFAVNEILLSFLGIKHRPQLMAAYRRRESRRIATGYYKGG